MILGLAFLFYKVHSTALCLITISTSTGTQYLFYVLYSFTHCDILTDFCRANFMKNMTMWQNYVELWQCGFHNESKAFLKSHLNLYIMMQCYFRRSIASLWHTFKAIKKIRYNVIAAPDQWPLFSNVNFIDCLSHSQRIFCINFTIHKKSW